jgi:hypothetical protein
VAVLAMHDAYSEASAKMSSDAQTRVSTNAFEQLAFLFHETRPDDDHEYIQVLGVIKNRRVFRWIRSDYLAGPESLNKYKVLVPAANGSGLTTDFFGVALNNPTVVEPGVAVTQTFITIGSFDAEARGTGVPEVPQVQVRQNDARRPKDHAAQPAKHVEVRPGTELHEHLGHRLV